MSRYILHSSQKCQYIYYLIYLMYLIYLEEFAISESHYYLLFFLLRPDYNLDHYNCNSFSR